MLSLIEDCLSTTEIFTCLNAQTAIWRNLLGDMKDGLKNITSAPEDYQIENQNVQALIRYIRACRKNDYPICPSFVEDCQNKLSKRNSEELMTISEEGNNTEKILEFFYKIQRTNNIMQWIPANYRVPEVNYGSFMQIAVPKEKAMTSAQKQVMIRSKLSRIRKKCYLRKDKNAANEYAREVHKYLRIFKPKTRGKE